MTKQNEEIMKMVLADESGYDIKGVIESLLMSPDITDERKLILISGALGQMKDRLKQALEAKDKEILILHLTPKPTT